MRKRVLWHSNSPMRRTGIGVFNKRLVLRLVKACPAFCPICNKGRSRPLVGSILVPSDIEELAKCGVCKRVFQCGKEVTVKVKEKRKPGMDLNKMIPDWYRCPKCHKILVGLMSWASHTAQEHGMSLGNFEKKYGQAEKSYYGQDFDETFNPSER